MNQKNKFKKIALLAANIGNDKKAVDIEIYELGKESSLAFYVVIMTAESAPQMSAIEDAVSIQLKQKGFYILYKDGPESKKWKVIDYGGIIVHIFAPVTREFYSLDKVYYDFKKVKWEKPPIKKAEKKGTKKPAIRKRTVKKKVVQKKPAKKKIKKKILKKKK
ncbi:MAG: ribosome silencing factor [Elusimicrobia bacterium]|nr:ribosome silencing factor [Elusimicrobiota bacterium]